MEGAGSHAAWLDASAGRGAGGLGGGPRRCARRRAGCRRLRLARRGDALRDRRPRVAVSHHARRRAVGASSAASSAAPRRGEVCHVRRRGEAALVL
eukprot:scaffold33764_cov55-Phaeocystis_antarctica.AAC.4